MVVESELCWNSFSKKGLIPNERATYLDPNRRVIAIPYFRLLNRRSRLFDLPKSPEGRR